MGADGPAMVLGYFADGSVGALMKWWVGVITAVHELGQSGRGIPGDADYSRICWR